MSGESIVFERGGKIVANSRDVATVFDKEHRNVLRDIRKLIGMRPELSRLNFEPAEYVDEQGKARPTYDMDRDGFTLLAMGFTGEKALDFKLRYIAAFNAMEAALKSDATVELPPYPEKRAFPEWPLEEMRTKNQTVTLYRLTYGLPAAQWIMPQLGFPQPPKHLITEGRQLEIAFESITITRGTKPLEE